MWEISIYHSVKILENIYVLKTTNDSLSDTKCCYSHSCPYSLPSESGARNSFLLVQRVRLFSFDYIICFTFKRLPPCWLGLIMMSDFSEVTLEDIADAYKRLLAAFHVEMLVHGNMSDQVRNELRNKTLPWTYVTLELSLFWLWHSFVNIYSLIIVLNHLAFLPFSLIVNLVLLSILLSCGKGVGANTVDSVPTMSFKRVLGNNNHRVELMNILVLKSIQYWVLFQICSIILRLWLVSYNWHLDHSKCGILSWGFVAEIVQIWVARVVGSPYSTPETPDKKWIQEALSMASTSVAQLRSLNTRSRALFANEAAQRREMDVGLGEEQKEKSYMNPFL